MSLDANKAIIQRYYDEVWNAGNLDVLDKIMAPGILHVQGTPGSGTQKEAIASYRARYQDLHYTISYLVAEGDMVPWQWNFCGTNAETGKKETRFGMTMNRIEDGKIIDRWMASRPRGVAGE